MDAYLRSLSKDDFERMKIVSALKELMVEEPFDAVTVTRLCKAAGVSRAVFYRLFKDLNDVVFWELFRLMRRSIEETSEAQNWREASVCALETYFSFLLEEQGFFQRIHREMSHDDYSAVFQSTRRFFRQRQLELVESAQGHAPDDRSVFEIDFFIYGVSNAIAAWAGGGMKEPPRVVAERIVNCMPSYLAQILDESGAMTAL